MKTLPKVNEPLPASDLFGALDEIPRADLIKMLGAAAWWTARRDFKGREGFSFDVEEETAYRDVIYRNATLYPTPEEAILGHWRTHYAPNDEMTSTHH